MNEWRGALSSFQRVFAPDTTFVVHPFFISLYPVVSFAASNISQMPVRGSFQSGAILLIASIILFVLAQFLLRNPYQSGVLVTFILLVYFSYGNALMISGTIGEYLHFLIKPGVLLAVFLCVAILGIWGIFRYLRASATLTKVLNFTSIVLLLLPSFRIAYFFQQYKNVYLASKDFQQLSMPQPGSFRVADLPDIYYIILDGYAREDVLADLYDYDNSSFIDFLRQEGFYVADSASSNYMQTALSISSSLNYEYLDFIPDQFGEKVQTRYPLVHLIDANRARAFLEANGYRTTAFETGYELTNLYDVDHFVKENGAHYLDALILNVLFRSEYIPSVSEASRRDAIRGIFKNLANIPSSGSPNFVFAHVVSPHPPFLFGPNGESLHSFSGMEDGERFPGGPASYIPKYRDQLGYITALVKQSIQAILSKPGKKPVIILQADHGPGAYLQSESADKSCIRERLSIMNAYYLPDGDTSMLYGSITPVNTFRIVFNQYFGTELALLEDHSYFSSWGSPYQFTDVSEEKGICPALEK